MKILLLLAAFEGPSQESSKENDDEMVDDENNLSTKLNYSGMTMKTCEESFSNYSLEADDENEDEPMGQLVIDNDKPGRGVSLVLPADPDTNPHMQLNITRKILTTEEEEFEKQPSHSSDPPEDYRHGHDELDISCRSVDSLDLSRQRQSPKRIKGRLQTNSSPNNRPRRQRRRRRRSLSLDEGDFASHMMAANLDWETN